jgi:hypothetical protein
MFRPLMWFFTKGLETMHRCEIFHPSTHIWRYSLFRALASLIRRLHSSLFAALLLHPLIPSSCKASYWTTSAHLVLGLPTGLVVWKFPFKSLFGILFSSFLIICPALYSLLIWMPSAMFGSLYKLYSSLFHLGRQHPRSCIGPYILRSTFLSKGVKYYVLKIHGLKFLL